VNRQEPVIELWNDLCNNDEANGAAEYGPKVGKCLDLIDRAIHHPLRKTIDNVLLHNLSVDSMTN
jgi:hypothetical protein